MQRAAILSILVALIGSCTKNAGTEAEGTSVTAACVVPEAARGLELVVTRSLLPMGAVPRRSETGTITSDHDCAAKEFCRRVSAQTMSAVYARVRPALQARHEALAASPHYGGRFIELHFDGGKCEIGDSSTAPVTAEDMPAFDAAFNAIVNAYAPADSGAP